MLLADPGRGAPRRRALIDRGGFSLTELIMALVILLILIPSVVPIYDAFLQDSKEESLKARLEQVRRAIIAFKIENGRYPYQVYDQYGNNVDFLNNRLSELTQGVHDGRGTYPLGRRIYLDRLPIDPITEQVNWRLIGVDNDGDGSFNEDGVESIASTHRTTATTRTLGGNHFSPSQPMPIDNDNDGLVDEDPVDVYDIRSRSRRFSDL